MAWRRPQLEWHAGLAALAIWIDACSTITFTSLARWRQTGPGLWYLMHSYWNITPIETCFLVASPVFEVKIIDTPQKSRAVLLSENSNM